MISRRETGQKLQLPSAGANSEEGLSVMVDSTIHFLGKQEGASEQRGPDIEVQNLSTDMGDKLLEPYGETVIDI